MNDYQMKEVKLVANIDLETWEVINAKNIAVADVTL